MSAIFFLFLPLVSHIVADDGLYSFLRRGRLHRHCHESGPPILPVEENNISLGLVLMSGLLFFLIFLGILKGLIGLCCSHSVGIYGLNLLIDLPRPLARYQEKSLERRPVAYDVGGWPIHPDTLDRTVRVIPKRTEFCLNLVFFLACPLAACVYICALFCCIRNLNKSQESGCFKHVDVVRLTTDHGGKNGNNKEPDEPATLDVYKEDYKEKQDTKYVMDTMKKSKESINEYRINIKTCSCHCEE